MKSYFFIFLFLLLFSSCSYAFEIGICEDAQGNSVDCGDNTQLYVPTCTYYSDRGQAICKLKNTPTAGVYDQKTGTCSNGVYPHLAATGELDCPVPKEVKLDSGDSDPDPSKDDKSCDPSKIIDPTKPVDPDAPVDDGGCASEFTAKTTNKLIAEGNSKLTAIAQGTTINATTLKGIADSISSLSAVPGDSEDTTCVEAGGLTCKDKYVSYSSTANNVGFCPADLSITILSVSHPFSFQPLCDFAEGVRGFVLGIAAFSSLLIVASAL